VTSFFEWCYIDMVDVVENRNHIPLNDKDKSFPKTNGQTTKSNYIFSTPMLKIHSCVSYKRKST